MTGVCGWPGVHAPPATSPSTVLTPLRAVAAAWRRPGRQAGSACSTGANHPHRRGRAAAATGRQVDSRRSRRPLPVHPPHHQPAHSRRRSRHPGPPVTPAELARIRRSQTPVCPAPRSHAPSAAPAKPSTTTHPRSPPHPIRDRHHPPRQQRTPKGSPMTLCTVDGCDRPHSARGLCRTHYWRLRNHGTVADDLPISRHTIPKSGVLLAGSTSPTRPCPLSLIARGSQRARHPARHLRERRKTHDRQ